MPGTVLIVEDEAELAALLRDVLVEADYDVVLTTGTAAVGRAAELHPALILMDFMMPGLNGDEVLEQLRERLGTEIPPVVLVTGRPEVRQLAKDVGADDFLYKPFEVDDLLSMVERLTSPSAPA